MKKIQLRNTLLALMLVTGLCLTSCGRNNSESEGEMDATETSGDIYGSESESGVDNESSGETGTDAGMATDTVTGTTTHGNTTGTGGATGTNSGSTGTTTRP